MRIGVFLGDFDPSSGGGYTFQANLAEAIKTFQCPHEFIIFHHGQGIAHSHCSVPIINLHFRYSKEKPRHDYEILKKIGAKIKFQGLSQLFARIIAFIRKRLVYIRSDGAVSAQTSLLQQAVTDYRVDVVWYLVHSYQKVTVPFLYTVWDLQHRVQPFFPEVSATGWDWDSREKHYSEILPRSMKVLTGTNVGKEEIVHFYGVNPDNVEVVPFPTPIFSFLDKPPAKNELDRKYNLNREYLIYPAQFWPHKNHIGLLHALEILIKKHSIHMDLVLVGSDKGNEAYVRDTSFELGVDSYVHLLGFVPDKDLIQLYHGAFALIFPTFFGPDNFPPLEAFALGCPVIASKVPGSEEQLRDAALFFDPKSPEEMATKIKSLYEDPQLQQSLISKGIERAKERSPYDYIKDVIRIIDDFELIKRCWKRDYELN